MNNDELFLTSLSEILKQLRENFNYLKERPGKSNLELAEDALDSMLIMEDIISEISSIHSLKDLDEEDFAFVFELFSDYVDTFIIDGRNPVLMQQQLEHYERLEQILEHLEDNYVPQDYE